MTETWKPVGCYQNKGRALGEILFKFKRFGGMKKKYGQCVTKANQKGATVFGLDDKMLDWPECSKFLWYLWNCCSEV